MIDHNTFGYLTFAFMTLSVLSGAAIFLSRRKAFWTRVHVVLGLITYLLMFITLWLVV